MKLRGKTLVVGVSLSLGALSALAQQGHPNVATGTRSETLYTVSGEDQINVLNGNLTYRLKLGEALEAGSKLTIAPTLVYNSSIWKTWGVERRYLTQNGDVTTHENIVRPAGDRVFATGWQTNFGRVLGGDSAVVSVMMGPSNPPPGAVVTAVVLPPPFGMWPTGYGYQAPGGSMHGFYDRRQESATDIGAPTWANWPCADAAARPAYLQSLGLPANGHCFGYAHDGSFLRFDPIDQEHAGRPVVYLPDGTRVVLGFAGGRWTQEFFTAAQYDPAKLDFSALEITRNTCPGAVPCPENGPWNATEILDSFGNKIEVKYYGQGGTYPDGTPVPAHPLAAFPANERDVIPWRIYDAALSSQRYFEFSLQAGANPPLVSTVTSLSSSSAGGAYERVTWTLGAGFQTATSTQPGVPVSTVSIPVLTSFSMPESQSYRFQYSGGGQLSQVTLPTVSQVPFPTGGLLQYDYATIAFFSAQFEECGGYGCVNFRPSGAVGVREKREVRDVRVGGPSGSLQTKTSATTYVRSYRSGDTGCTPQGNPLDCRMRVDVWQPRGFDVRRRITRTTFHESNSVANTALYGRPITTHEYWIDTPDSTVPTDSVVTSNAWIQETAFSYDFDGPRSGSISTGWGTEHNVREVRRFSTWNDGHWKGTDKTVSPDGNPNWDPLTGHLRRSIVLQGVTTTDPGVVLTDTSEAWHLLEGPYAGVPDRWNLSVLASRRSGRPPDIYNDAEDNLSSAESYTVDAATGFVTSRKVVSDNVNDSRTLTTSWTRGTAASGPCGPALPQGGPGVVYDPTCGNLGFPVSETQTISGAYRGFALSSAGNWSARTSYTKNLYYRYSTPSAAWDPGATFLTLDRDVAPTGKTVGSRGTEGRARYSLAREGASPGYPILTTTSAYDRLGRIKTVQAPSEVSTTYTYGSQWMKEKRVDISNPVSLGSTLFDQLGRPSARVRLMPISSGGPEYSYQLVTYDDQGRKVSTSEWQGTSCATEACVGDALLNAQADIQGGTSVNTDLSVVNPKGTVDYAFSIFGPPRNTSFADGSRVDRGFSGWWYEEEIRRFNTSATTALTRRWKNALGEVTNLNEPPAQNATGGTMNNEEQTAYWYDHQGRVIRTASVKGDHLGGAPATGQVRRKIYDDFGWIVRDDAPETTKTNVNPVVPGGPEVLVRDARGNPVLTTDDSRDRGDPNYQIYAEYDAFGRFLRRRSGAETDPNNWFERTDYEKMPEDYGDYYNFGKANGRAVRTTRRNHVATTVKVSAVDPPIDAGYFEGIDFFHYTDSAGRLAYRQHAVWEVAGYPVNPAGRPSLYGETKKKDKYKDDFLQFFRSSGFSAQKHEDAVASAQKDPSKPKGAKDGEGPSTNSAGATTLGSATAPIGWLHWSYLYDNAGRLSLVRYPRRDEGTTENAATTVEYLYDNGWNHRQYVKLRNPFGASPDAVYDSSRADLTYNTSGSSKSTALWHETSPGSFSYTKIFETQSPDDTSGMARPASWNVLGGPAGSNVATLPFAYDKSGNITSIGSDAYLYDSRSRLIQDSIVSRSAALNPERREYDGFGNIRRVTNGGNVATLAVNMGNNRLSESGMVWDEARGQLRYDTKDARNMWRDFYPDGRQLTDYYTLSGNVIDLLRGWSASLYDGAGERSLEYWSGGHDCSDQVFRVPLRGDDAKVLTDYRGQYASGECTYAVQWSKDYVWIGNRAQILLDRDSGTVRWRALNHLGTPRWAFDSAGNLTGQEQLDSWGGVIGTTLNERHKFTGHERDHALLANGYGPDPNPMADYMHTRTYVPMLGRFTAPDSLSRFTLFPQAMNRYAYALNNPVKYVDPDGRAIILAGHNALPGTDFTHLTILIVPENNALYSRNELFTGNGDYRGQGKAFATLGAGPEHKMPPFGNLVGAANRKTDVDMSTKTYFKKVDIGDRNEDQVIADLMAADVTYKDDLPYEARPGKESPGYNSNSYVSGLLLSVGLVPPPVNALTPGYNKPVPTQKFDGGPLSTEDTRLKAIGLKKGSRGIEPI